MKISKEVKGLLKVLFICASIILLVHLGIGYTIGKTVESAKDKNEQLKANIETLGQYISQKESYKTETDKYKKLVDDSINTYSSGYDAKDMLQYLYNMKSDYGIDSLSVSFMPKESVGTFLYDVAGKEENVIAYATSTTFNYSTDYSKLKEFIDETIGSSTHTSIMALSISYNALSSGVTGSMTLVRHTLSAGKDTFDGTTDTGIDGLFGTGNGD